MNPTHIDIVTRFLEWLGRASWQAAVIAMIVFAVQMSLGERLAARWKYNLWMLVLLRLVIPVLPASPVSVFNLVPQAQTQAIHNPEPIKAVGKVEATPHVGPAEFKEDSTAIVKYKPVTWSVAKAPANFSVVCWPCVLLIGWAIGAVFLGGRVVFACWRLRAEIRRCRVLNNPEILQVMEECSAALGIRRSVQLLVTDHLPGPALAGLWRPRILLPDHVVQRFDREELQLILLHELVHLRRHDIAMNWVMTLAHIAHWFNPVIWLAMARCRVDRELACDEAVLGMERDGDCMAYGQTILKLIETAARGAVDAGNVRSAALPGMVGILERPHPMRRRMNMIANFATRKQTWPVAAAVVMLAIALAGLTDAVRAQDAKTTKDAARTSAAPSGSVSAGTLNLTTNGPIPLSTNVAEAAKILAGPTTAAKAQGGFNGSESVRVIPDDPEMQQVMDRVLPEVKFDSVPISDVLDFLRDATGVNIVVNWKSLEAAGLDRNAPISLHVKNVRFAKVLELLATQIGGGTAPVQFNYADRVLTLGAGPEGKPPTVRVVYDVNDLIQEVLSKSPTTKPAVNVRQDVGTDLVKVIESHVAPDSWKDRGGYISDIDEFNGKLVVTTTAENQKEIQQLLRDLRSGSAQGSEIKVQPAADGEAGPFPQINGNKQMTRALALEYQMLWDKAYAEHAKIIDGKLANRTEVELQWKRAIELADGERAGG